MIISPHHLDSNFNSDTPRQYLEMFYPKEKILVITDQNINQNYNAATLEQHIKQSNVDRVLLDFSHNPYPIRQRQQQTDQLIKTGQQHVPTSVLINDYSYHIDPQENFQYFPVFTWMFSQRRAYWWHTDTNTFDMPSNKTKVLCCLNRNPTWHRIVLFNQLAKHSWFDQIAYTFGNYSPAVPYVREHRNGLTEEEKNEFDQNQHLLPRWVVEEDRAVGRAVYSINHPVHETHAYNLITETVIDNQFFHSEKTCKPFMARQIPIILGAPGINQYLSNLGLDMFEDIVPWQSWDSIESHRTRIYKTVEFINQLMHTDALEIYRGVLSRVEKNKEYFHSQQFRDCLMTQMPKLYTSPDTDESCQ